jgi:hypothetical protein
LQVLFTADLRVFRDYDQVSEGITGTVAPVKIEDVVTPVKRKVEEMLTPAPAFPLTPPDIVKSETISLDVKIETETTIKGNENFVRRSKRRKGGNATDDPFGEI